MKDEFTDAMHADMMGWSQEDIVLIVTYVFIRRGCTKGDACKKSGITEVYYDENIDAVMKRCFNI